MIGERIDADHVVSGPRGSELTLLAVELALRGREPGRAVPDLAELAALHAGSCPELAARLPQVAALLRSRPGPRARADMAAGQTTMAPCSRVDVKRIVHLDSREVAKVLGITASGSRYLAGHGHLPGSRHNPVTGRWEIPLSAVDAYAARRSMRRLSA